MCDYSLHAVRTRNAAVGDDLVTHMFEGHITRGMADPADMGMAVCLLPGTEVGFEEDIEAFTGYLYSTVLNRYPHRVAKFIQIDLDNPYTHHDALELPDGTKLLIHSLADGQRAKVLQLPAKPQLASEEVAAVADIPEGVAL